MANHFSTYFNRIFFVNLRQSHKSLPGIYDSACAYLERGVLNFLALGLPFFLVLLLILAAYSAS